VAGSAYGVLAFLRSYGKRFQIEDPRDVLHRQAEDMQELRSRCEELEQRRDSAERRLLRHGYRPVVTQSEGS